MTVEVWLIVIDAECKHVYKIRNTEYIVEASVKVHIKDQAGERHHAHSEDHQFVDQLLSSTKSLTGLFPRHSPACGRCRLVSRPAFGGCIQPLKIGVAALAEIVTKGAQSRKPACLAGAA